MEHTFTSGGIFERTLTGTAARATSAVIRTVTTVFAAIRFASTVAASRVAGAGATGTICIGKLAAAIAAVVTPAPKQRTITFHRRAVKAIVTPGSAPWVAAILHGAIRAVGVTELASAIALAVTIPGKIAVVLIKRPAVTDVAPRGATTSRHRGRWVGGQRRLYGGVSGAFVGVRHFPQGTWRRNILVRWDR